MVTTQPPSAPPTPDPLDEHRASGRTASNHNQHPTTQRSETLHFLKRRLPSQRLGKYERSFYPTYLRERGQSFNTDRTSLKSLPLLRSTEEPVLSPTPFLESARRTWLFLGEKWGNVRMDFAKMLSFWFKTSRPNRAREISECVVQCRTVRSEGQWRQTGATPHSTSSTKYGGK